MLCDLAANCVDNGLCDARPLLDPLREKSTVPNTFWPSMSGDESAGSAVISESLLQASFTPSLGRKRQEMMMAAPGQQHPNYMPELQPIGFIGLPKGSESKNLAYVAARVA